MTALWLPALAGRNASHMPAKIWSSTVSAPCATTPCAISSSERPSSVAASSCRRCCLSSAIDLAPPLEFGRGSRSPRRRSATTVSRDGTATRRGSEARQDVARHRVAERRVTLEDGIGVQEPLVRADEGPAERRVAGQGDVVCRPQGARMPLVAEIVERDRLPRLPHGTRDPGRDAVEGHGARLEHDTTIEQRRDAPDAPGYARVPELEPAAMGLVPPLVQEE